MRFKTLIYLALPLIVVSCQDSANSDLQTSNGKLYAQSDSIRSIDDAIEIANTAAIEFFGENTRSKPRIATKSSNVTPIYAQLSRSDEESPVLYVVNYDNDEGFAVITANSNLVPVLAVTEEGSYTVGEVTNTGFDDYMTLAISNINRIGIIKPTITITEKFKEFKTETSDYTMADIPAKLAVKWGQDYIYNTYCLGNPTGCGPTALAQIMSYFEYPAVLPLTFEGAPSNSVTLVWSSIKQHVRSYAYSCADCSATSSTHDAIGCLFREVGERAGCTYSTDTSVSDVATTLSSLRNAAQKLGYTVSKTQTYAENCEKAELESGGLLLMSGVPDSTSSIGHAWVVDGYKHIRHAYSEYTRDYGTVVWTLERTVLTDSYYTHVNWGWDGLSNGYFYTGIFDTSTPYTLDDSTLSSTGHKYAYNLHYIVISH
jgi:hypothetical protein